jgi:alpha-galactosidase
MKLASSLCITALGFSLLVTASAKPLKAFILAGQSNMEGHAKVETFDYIGDDPATAPLLRKMLNPDGTPHICDGAWISYLTGMGENNGEGHGKLTTGYGGRSNPAEYGGKIGPEFTFGITMDDTFDEPVLIIKTAWGGKSLHTDFRPPSAGPYELNDWQKNIYPTQEGHGIPEDFEQWKADKVRETGQYYKLMIDHVKSVLADPKRICPEYNENEGFEIAGFVWFQAWNDMVDTHTYPNHGKPERHDGYSDLLAHFIRDVRKDLSAPDMPFVIGVVGVDGENVSDEDMTFRKAMAAPASLPEFKGNVVAVQTAPFWDEKLGAIEAKYAKLAQMGYLLKNKDKSAPNKDGTMSEEEQKTYLMEYEAKLTSPEEVVLRQRGASNAGYHYLGCAKTFAVMGKAFADALLSVQK